MHFRKCWSRTTKVILYLFRLSGSHILRGKQMYGNTSTWGSLGHEDIRNQFPWSGGWLACSILRYIWFLSSELWRHDTSQRVQAGIYGYKPHRDDFQLGTKENFLKEMISWYQVTLPSQDVSKLSTQDQLLIFQESDVWGMEGRSWQVHPTLRVQVSKWNWNWHHVGRARLRDYAKQLFSNLIIP